MTTPARSHRAERQGTAGGTRRMTAEEFGARIGAILGRPWPRQAVYLLEQGDRRVTAEEVATIALVFGVSVADLFTPDAEVDEVQVGRQRIPRERLLAQGQKDGAQLYEVARHSQALERCIQGSHPDDQRTAEGARQPRQSLEWKAACRGASRGAQRGPRTQVICCCVPAARLRTSPEVVSARTAGDVSRAGG